MTTNSPLDQFTAAARQALERYDNGDYDQTRGPAYERAGIDPQINADGFVAALAEQFRAGARAVAEEVIGTQEVTEPNLTGGIAAASRNRKIDQRNALRAAQLARLDRVVGGGE